MKFSMFLKRKSIFNELTPDELKNRTNVLFIDDQQRDDVIKRLNSEGWHCEQLLEKDLSAIDIPIIKHSHIICIDIKGVGKQLGLKNEGLDLLIQVQKHFPEKKTILYSSESKHQAFHPAFRSADAYIEKSSEDYSMFYDKIRKLSEELFSWETNLKSIYKTVKIQQPQLSYDRFEKSMYKLLQSKNQNFLKEDIFNALKVSGEVVTTILKFISLLKGINV